MKKKKKTCAVKLGGHHLRPSAALQGTVSLVKQACVGPPQGFQGPGGVPKMSALSAPNSHRQKCQPRKLSLPGPAA